MTIYKRKHINEAGYASLLQAINKGIKIPVGLGADAEMMAKNAIERGSKFVKDKMGDLRSPVPGSSGVGKSPPKLPPSEGDSGKAIVRRSSSELDKIQSNPQKEKYMGKAERISDTKSQLPPSSPPNGPIQKNYSSWRNPLLAGAAIGAATTLSGSTTQQKDKNKPENTVHSQVDTDKINAAISGDAPTRIVDTGKESGPKRNLGASSTTIHSSSSSQPQRDRINKPVQYNKPEKRGMFGLTQSEYDEINKDVEKEHTRKLADIDAEEKKNQADIQAKYANIRKRTGLPPHPVKEEHYDLDEGRFLPGNIPHNFNPRTFADIGKEAKKVARNAWNSRDALGQEITDSIYNARKSIAGIAVGGGALGDYLTHKNEPKEKEYEKRSLTLPDDEKNAIDYAKKSTNVSNNYDRNTQQPHSGYKDDTLSDVDKPQKILINKNKTFDHNNWSKDNNDNWTSKYGTKISNKEYNRLSSGTPVKEEQSTPIPVIDRIMLAAKRTKL